MQRSVELVMLDVQDYEAIRDLWVSAGLSIKPRGRDSREQFEQQMRGGQQQVIGARLDGELVGVIVTTHDGRKGWLNRLAVLPTYRHQGIGVQLIAEAERVLHDRGIHVVAALVEGWNTASLKLLEKTGYSDFPDIHYFTKRDSQGA